MIRSGCSAAIRATDSGCLAFSGWAGGPVGIGYDEGHLLGARKRGQRGNREFRGSHENHAV
jgi:hypothetical protein